MEVPGIITSLLQALKKGILASILSFFTQILPVPVAVTVLYLTNKNNIERLIYCYPLHSAFGLVVSTPIGIIIIKSILKKINEQKIGKDDENKLEDISISSSIQFTKKNQPSNEDNNDTNEQCSMGSSADEQNIEEL